MENPQEVYVSIHNVFDAEGDDNIYWYSSSELRGMRLRVSAIVRSFCDQSLQISMQQEHHLSPEELDTMHGVETLIRSDILQKTRRERVAHTNAIMNEQTRQDSDANTLAKNSTVYSARASERARAIGLFQMG